MAALPRPIEAILVQVERPFAAARVSPDGLTVTSLVVAGLSGAAFATGWQVAGGLLFLASGLLDSLDGRIARRTGTSSPAGAYLDSVADRLAEIAVFGGLAYHAGGGLPLAAVLGGLGSSLLVSYTRARGESLGVTTAEVGLFQRPVRIITMGVAAITAQPVVLWSACAILAVLGGGTAWSRFRYVRGRLGAHSRSARSHASTAPAMAD